MRLTATQIHAIKTATHAVLGEGAQVSLFGSRVDDARRGGDIDLYITGTNLSMVAQLDAKLDLLVKLKQALGEQRIDIVFGPAAGQEPLPIQRMAAHSALPL
jgi:uncharacterized protein